MKQNKEDVFHARSLRIRAGIRQSDVSLLLGFRHSSSISQIENRQRQPKAHECIGYAVVFNQSSAKMLRALQENTQGLIRKRITALEKSLKKANTPDAPHRLLFLQNLRERLDKQIKHPRI